MIQGNTGDKGGYRGITRDTGGYREIQRNTEGYRGYKGIQGDTRR